MMRTLVPIFVLGASIFAFGQNENFNYDMRSMQGSLVPMQGPIYMPAETILEAAFNILGQQQQPPPPPPPQSYRPQVLPPQIFYEEEYDTVNQRPDVPQEFMRRSNTNVQSGIQQIGKGNMNLQGNIQQINRRRTPENGRRSANWELLSGTFAGNLLNGRRNDAWDALKGKNIKNLNVHQHYNIVEDESDADASLMGVDIGSDFNVENVHLKQDVNVLSAMNDF